MKRRDFLSLVALAGAALARPGLAQTKTGRKIGWLKIQSADQTPGQLKAFIEGLRQLGYTEGEQFTIEARHADGDVTKLQPMASDLVQSGAAIIVATSQPALDAAFSVTKTVPLVARMTDDPVKTGKATSLSKPGGNVSGVYSLLEEMTTKRLALLKQAVPNLSRVGALLTLDRGNTAFWLAQTKQAAETMGLDVHVMDVHGEADLEGAFAQAVDNKVNGLIAFRNPTVVTYDRKVAELCRQHAMPAIFDARDFVSAGGFMSYGPNLDAIFRDLAGFCDKVLNGQLIGDLPIAQPTAFELVVNMKLAKTLGIQPSANFLATADEIIE